MIMDDDDCVQIRFNVKHCRTHYANNNEMGLNHFQTES